MISGNHCQFPSRLAAAGTAAFNRTIDLDVTFMKRFTKDTFSIMAKQAAKALPKDTQTGKISLNIGGKYIQEITIISTVSNFEGFVRWFVCPGCGNRVAKLYLPTGETVFLCRKCYQLAYRSQQLRAFKRPEKAKDKTPKKKYTNGS